MAVKVVFVGGPTPEDYRLWNLIAEAVLQGRSGCVLARQTLQGWDVSLQDSDSVTFGTLAHPHSDGDFERELRSALRAAGLKIAPF